MPVLSLQLRKNINIFVSYINLLIIIFVLFYLFSSDIFAAEVTLRWDKNNDGDIAGYNVYYGKSKDNYDKSKNVGNNTTATVTGLTVGAEYFFAVTAYDRSLNESDFSNSVSYVTDNTTNSNHLTIASVSSKEDPSEVVIVYSESVTAESAENISNYFINNGITIHGASLSTDYKKVTLKTSNHSEGIIYTLSIINIVNLIDPTNIIPQNSSIYYTYTTLNGSSSGVFSDNFSTDKTKNYTVIDKLWSNNKGPGSFDYDAIGRRAQVSTKDNVGIQFSHSLPTSSRGSFSIDFLPTKKHPYGGWIELRLMQDAKNYYEISNSDGYGPYQVKKVVDGVEVENVPFTKSYIQNTNYKIKISFSATFTTVNAFGNFLTLNTNTTNILVDSFEVQTMQQDAFYDNIEYN